MADTQRRPYTPLPGVTAQAVIETLLIIVGLLAQALLLQHGMYGDGKTRFLTLSALLEKGQLLPTPYSLVGPLFSLPFWLLGKWLWTAEELCQYYNLFLFVLALLVASIVLRKRIPSGLLRKFFLILVAASMFAMHVTTYYGEVFTAVCVGFGLLFITFSTYRIPAWIAVILGVVNTPASIGGLLCLTGVYMLEKKRWRYVLVPVAAIALIMAEAWLRRGSPFSSGYEHDAGYRTVMPYSGLPGFSYPFFFGLLSILLSFGKGIFFFAPGLLLPIKKVLSSVQATVKLALCQTYMLWLAFIVGLVLVYARWWAWYGGLFWGPRFFLIASIPASFALALYLENRAERLITSLMTLLVLCLSFWVGLDGAIYANVAVAIPQCIANQAQLELLCHYTPEFSALWYPFVVHPALTWQQILYAIYALVAFTYLALPLLIRIGVQLAALIKVHSVTYLRNWHW